MQALFQNKLKIITEHSINTWNKTRNNYKYLYGYSNQSMNLVFLINYQCTKYTKNKLTRLFIWSYLAPMHWVTPCSLLGISLISLFNRYISNVRANSIKIIVNQVFRINGNVKSLKQIININITNDVILVYNISRKINFKRL